MLKFNHINAAYHAGYPILSDINLEIGSHEQIALLGRNGAGKTTFANTVFGNVPIISGEIIFNGINLRSSSLEKISNFGIGYFMQDAPVFTQMTVKENLIMAAGRKGADSFPKRYEEIRRLMPLFAERSVEKMLAGSLSGGERTQLCLSMVIFNKPDLLILDEPFAGLSPTNSRQILKILEEYRTDTKASVIMIAQDRYLASNFCNTLYVIREGKIQQD